MKNFIIVTAGKVACLDRPYHKILVNINHIISVSGNEFGDCERILLSDGSKLNVNEQYSDIIDKIWEATE